MGLKYENEEELLISKVDDKINFTKTKNKIQFTDFLGLMEKSKIEKYLKQRKFSNYFFFGGNENSERGIFVFYPDKLEEEMAKSNLSSIVSVIKIRIPKEEAYEHKVYLSAVMKLGLKREKIGDIVVLQNGADIVVFNENIDYIINGLKQLTRFRRAEIESSSIYELENRKIEFEDISIIVSSIRLDSIVSELSKCSRGKAEEYIELGKVFVNSIQEFKDAKKIVSGDVITIRGKGKFIYTGIQKETSKSRLVLLFKKYK